jgi:Hypothetical glycosyl hydrolase family 15
MIGRAALAGTFLSAAGRTLPGASAATRQIEALASGGDQKFPLLAFQIGDEHNLQSDSQFGSFQAVAPLFDRVILQDWPLGAGAVPILRAGKAKMLLYYRILLNDYGGGGYQDAWYLRDRAGNRVPTGDGGYLMNPGQPGFRASWINTVSRRISTNGLDGLFIDGPAGYAHTPTWHQDIVQFMKEIRSALPGKQIAANSLLQYYAGPNGGGELDFAPYVDQYDCEVFMGTFPWEHDPSHYDADRAQASLAASLKVLSMGKAVSVSSGFTWNFDAALKRRWQTFQYAGYLMLVGNGPVYWWWGYNYKANYDFPELHMSVGTPIGPAQQSGRVWKREFTKATVRVDLGSPTSASITPK